MTLVKSSRIESIDILRGLAMVIMALDHVRDYFHYGSFFVNPTDLETTTPFLFFTRFITHNCAPAFIFLAGTSAFLYGGNKPKPELSKFLLSRGLWLVFLEISVNGLIWTFDLTYSNLVLQVIWAIGLSMITLSFLIYLPKKALLIIGFVLIAGHNLLDHIIMEGTSLKSMLWYILHQRTRVELGPDQQLLFGYPVIPWIGLMVLGYCFGALYRRGFDPALRRKWLLGMGFGAIALFYVIRGINGYGDPVPWSVQKNTTYTLLSFFNVTKYPPSLVYMLITIGPAMLFLAVIEPVKNRPLAFRTLNVGRPEDVTLVPYHTLFGQRYAIYWRIVRDGSPEYRKILADEKARRARLARTVDEVAIGNRDSEKAHAFEGENTQSGSHIGRAWRHAVDGGWFSYTLAVLPDEPMILSCTYWGSDSGRRTFDVLVDGERIATQTLDRNRPGEFFDVTYAVGAELIRGKKKVSVRFQAVGGATAGGIFGLRMLRGS
jgi:uncharacterized membrane protein